MSELRSSRSLVACPPACWQHCARRRCEQLRSPSAGCCSFISQTHLAAPQQQLTSELDTGLAAGLTVACGPSPKSSCRAYHLPHHAVLLLHVKCNLRWRSLQAPCCNVGTVARVYVLVGLLQTHHRHRTMVSDGVIAQECLALPLHDIAASETARLSLTAQSDSQQQPIRWSSNQQPRMLKYSLIAGPRCQRR